MTKVLSNPTVQTISILICTVLFTSTLAAAQAQTIVVVIEGQVYCFEIEGYKGEQLDIGKLLFKVSDKDYIVKVRDSSITAFVPEGKQSILSPKLAPGTLVLLRFIEPDKWEIVSVGISVTQGELYTKGKTIPVGAGYTAKLIPSAPPSAQESTETVSKDITKREGTEETGTGTGTVKTVEEINPEVPEELPSSPPEPPPPPQEEEYPGPDYYVDPQNGDDDNSGAQNSPLRTIQAALGKIEEKGFGTVYLASGRYSPSTNGETFPLRVPSEVNIIGTDRDSVILDAEDSSGLLYLTSNIDIKNLTILNGHEECGGGILANDCNSVTIEDVVFESCYARAGGGAIHIMNTSGILLNRCIFRNNQAPGSRGGGIVYCDGSSAEITNCLFYSNSGYYGCITWYSSSGGVSWCTFDGNTATGGACIYFGYGPNSSLTVVNNIFANSSDGYALYDTNRERDITVDYNFFYSNSPRHYWKDRGPVAIVGVDHNIGNPRSSPLRSNHKIQSGTVPTPIDNADPGNAPANGEDLTGPGRRPNGRGYDMGCYEWYGDSDPDPVISGYVYNSVTQKVINQPVVAIYRADTTEPVAVTTDNPFRFNVDAGRYYIVAYKEGFAFPSRAIDRIVLGDHGEVFTVTDQPVEMGIPLDPQYWLEIEKRQNKEAVEIGEILTYHFTIRNHYWFNEVPDVILHDQLVNGFKYVKGSLYVNGEPYSDENVSIAEHTIRIHLGTIPRFSTSTVISLSNRLSLSTISILPLTERSLTSPSAKATIKNFFFLRETPSLSLVCVIPKFTLAGNPSVISTKYGFSVVNTIPSGRLAGSIFRRCLPEGTFAI